MLAAAIITVIELWIFAAGIHFFLPETWMQEWYGFSLYVTIILSLTATFMHFVSRDVNKKKD